MSLMTDPDLARTADAQTRTRHLPGEAGLWVFILGDMLMFGVFFVVIGVLQAQQPQVFRAGQDHLHVDLAVLNTLFLLTGSWLVARAVRGLKRTGGTSPALFVAALACGLGFAAVKAVEYVALIDAGQTPQTDDFFMYYFIFTGIHLAHLALGTVLLLCLAIVVRRPALTPGQVMFVEGGGVYWHLVDMLWLVLFPLLYLVR